MLFNSIEFAIFLPLVFLIYWFLVNKNLRIQNLMVLSASYYFYGCWDYRFLSLIVISSLVDYLVGLKLYSAKKPIIRKLLLFCSLFVNLGFLGFFKYFNFFIESLQSLLEGTFLSFNTSSLNIILPVGISFYTFQTLSYTIDIYRKEIKPTRDIIAFFAFVGFFPQLVAGPIERAKSLLPQFLATRAFEYDKAKDGLRRILWGLFKKIVIADVCGEQADLIFENNQNMGGGVLVLGCVFFAFQIYGDFSGYSDIAIGSARLFGFNLMQNFALPYFSRDISEFWKRWHISLSSWFRDYVYIPLAGSRCSKARRSFNIIFTFTLSGLWHGANWTFMFWGFLNGLYYLPLMLADKTKTHRDFAGLQDLFKILITFCLTLLAWIFFRATSLSHAFSYIARIFSSPSFLTFPPNVVRYLGLIVCLLIFEWIQRRQEHPLKIDFLPVWIRWLLYLVLCLCVITFAGEKKEFIYFQF